MSKQQENPIPPFLDANIDAIIEAEQAANRSWSPSEVTVQIGPSRVPSNRGTGHVGGAEKRRGSLAEGP
jgi:hypothetical protein